ncbi:MAG: 2-keto-4-pentenoate hydratase, partial [Rhodospirillales bacterium]
MAFDKAAAERAAEWIAAARLGRRSIGEMPAALRPSTPSEGYAIQAALRQRLAAAGRGALAGWKVGATTLPMRKLLNMPEPVAGGILASAVLRSPARLSFADFIKPGIECEVCMRMKSPLPAKPGKVDRKAAGEAVGEMCAAIEVVDNRYGDFARIGAPTIIADDVFQAAVVLGEWRADWRELDLVDCVGTASVDGVTKLEGRGLDVMGHPLESLAWLANLLDARGERLEPGQIAMTGSLTLPYWANRGEKLQTRIDGLERFTDCLKRILRWRSSWSIRGAGLRRRGLRCDARRLRRCVS